MIAGDISQTIIGSTGGLEAVIIGSSKGVECTG